MLPRPAPNRRNPRRVHLAADGVRIGKPRNLAVVGVRKGFRTSRSLGFIPPSRRQSAAGSVGSAYSSMPIHLLCQRQRRHPQQSRRCRKLPDQHHDHFRPKETPGLTPDRAFIHRQPDYIHESKRQFHRCYSDSQRSTDTRCRGLRKSQSDGRRLDITDYDEPHKAGGRRHVVPENHRRFSIECEPR